MFYYDKPGSTFESRRLAGEKAAAFDVRVAELLEEMKDAPGDPKEQVLAAVYKAQSEIFPDSNDGELIYEYD